MKKVACVGIVSLLMVLTLYAMEGPSAASTLYDILRVPLNASSDAITYSYEVLMRQYHPDKFVGKPRSVQEAMEREREKIRDAYEILSNPQAKEMYDWEGEGAARIYIATFKQLSVQQFLQETQRTVDEILNSFAQRAAENNNDDSLLEAYQKVASSFKGYIERSNIPPAQKEIYARALVSLTLQLQKIRNKQKLLTYVTYFNTIKESPFIKFWEKELMETFIESIENASSLSRKRRQPVTPIRYSKKPKTQQDVAPQVILLPLLPNAKKAYDAYKEALSSFSYNLLPAEQFLSHLRGYISFIASNKPRQIEVLEELKKALLGRFNQFIKGRPATQSQRTNIDQMIYILDKLVEEPIFSPHIGYIEFFKSFKNTLLAEREWRWDVSGRAPIEKKKDATL